MAEDGGGNPEPRNMVSAQPPTVNSRPLLLRIFCWSRLISISEKQSISAGSPSSAIFNAEPRSEMSSTRYSVSGSAAGRLAARLCPEYRLSTNERRSFTHDNALTELAVRSSLSGRVLYGAGCNTYPRIIPKLSQWFNTWLCINGNAPAGG